MANDESEEKTLPASKKKLRDARKKGQVPRSKDLVSGAATAASLGFLLLGGGTVVGAASAMLETAGDVAGGDFLPGLHAVWNVTWPGVLRVVAPLVGLTVLMVVVTSMIMMQGIPFAIDPITPKFDHINPAEGFKRLFKLKQLVELVKSLTKMLLLAAILVAVLAGGLRALVLTPACGLGCVEQVFQALLVPLLAATSAMFIVAGLADVGLQRWLFLRDQRMSITEQRRERKDQEGDPHVRRHRKKLQREAAQAKVALGLRRAMLLVYDSGQVASGIRFKLGETEVPVVVCRARGLRVAAMVAEARTAGVTVVEDADLSRVLSVREPGQMIPEGAYRATAQYFAKLGLI